MAVDPIFLHPPDPSGPNPDLRDRITLPSAVLGTEVTFQEQRDVSLLPGSRTWFGASAAGETDELIVTIYEDAVSGFLSVAGTEYVVEGDTSGLLTIRPIIHDDCDVIESTKSTPALESGSMTLDGAASQSSVPGGIPATTGPFNGYDAVVDVIAVYGPPAIASAGSEANVVAAVVSGVATTNRALENSQVNAVVRLLDVQNIGWSSASTPGDAWAQLNDASDGSADDVDAIRDDAGADGILGIIEGGAGAGGSALVPFEPDSSTGETHENFVVRVNSTVYSIRHEFAHIAGVHHTKQVPQNVVDYAYGYAWPDKDVVTDPSTICPSGEAFHTIVNKSTTITINGVDFIAPRVNGYSNPDLTLSRCGGTKQIALGTDVPNSNGLWCDAARRLRETLPTVADYRPATNMLLGAEISSPPPGGSAGTFLTFSWNAVSPSGSYWLEIYDPATTTHYFDAAVSGTSQLVTGLPGTNSVLAARLWTDMNSDPDAQQWVWVDHRYNNDLVLVDCDADPGVSPADSYFQGQTCDDPVGAVCALLGGVLECDLQRSGAAVGGQAFAVSNFYPGHAYDLSIWGQGDSGEDFCCLLHDPGDVVTDVEIFGTDNGDWLSLLSGPYQLDTYGGTSLSVDVRARDGVDWVIGSGATSVAYEERLRGGAGNDVLVGNGGDDELRGGPDDDSLNGDDGNDVLIGGSGVDVLNGDGGMDVLCSETTGDQLFGGGSVNTLYLSSQATGPAPVPDSSDAGFAGSCGHTIWGGLWAGNCSYTLTTAPAECAAAGIPD